MKILLIGIDGGDRRIIQTMPMPNLHKIIDQNICLDVQEDLWSRGWAEILSGVHGRESGAFYAKPKLDGTHETTQDFSVFDYSANPNLKPLWSRLSERGHSVGFMNVPSMMPAPKVNGFAVSGGGAGAATSGAVNIPLEACYPTDVREILVKKGYILDTRFVSSGLRDVNAYFERLIQMTRLRTEAFIHLQDRFHVQFGFVAFMAFNRVQNLAMSEIEALIRNNCMPVNSFQEKLVHFYGHVDEQIGRLVSDLSPMHVMLVSDHGQSPRQYSVNVNSWLQTIGMQVRPSQSARLGRQAAKALASVLPKSIRQSISFSAPKARAKLTGLNADWKTSRAFGVRYVPGIYINDNQRFGGPIHSEKEIQLLVEKIIFEFNRSPEHQNHGLTARPYRQEYKDLKHEAFFPDVWIDHPDTYFFEQHGQFIEPNTDYGPIKSLKHVDRDMFTGIKGRHPLLCVHRTIANLVQENDDLDLTLAYKLIVRGMGV